MRTWLAVVGILSLLVVVCAGGCGVTREPSQIVWNSEALAAAAPIDWPQRPTDRLFDLQLGGYFVAAEGSFELDDLQTGDLVPPEALTFFPPHSLSVRGQGWLRELIMPVNPGRIAIKPFQFLCWHDSKTFPEPLLNDIPENPTERDARIEKVLATADYRHTFLLQMPTTEPRGLVVHAFSMSPSEPEATVVNALRQRGWAVLWTGELSIRTRRDSTGAPAGSGAGQPVGDPAETYIAAAELLEQVMASYAYAYEAAVGHVRQQVPVLQNRPIIVAGFSMGAIMSPTVAARLGDDVSALVLVGGGADLPAIASESPITRRWGPLMQSRPKLSAAAYRQLREEYLARTQLDPYATAPLLRNRPVLVVQARWDNIVPARYGDLLWERLGRPERWMFRGGHLMLFWSLGRYAEEIAAWADAAAMEYWTARHGIAQED